MARYRIYGTEIMGEHPYCERCAPVASDSDMLSRSVPNKNRYALISYYLAVFSLIPCVGALLALAAVPLGAPACRRRKGACVGRHHFGDTGVDCMRKLRGAANRLAFTDIDASGLDFPHGNPIEL